MQEHGHRFGGDQVTFAAAIFKEQLALALAHIVNTVADKMEHVDRFAQQPRT